MASTKSHILTPIKAGSGAFLDTTIIADAVLKHSDIRTRIRAALKTFSDIQYPGYAVKEFDLGVWNAFRIAHNYLVEELSFVRPLARISKGLGTQSQNLFRSMFAACIRAEQDAMASCSRVLPQTERERARELYFQLGRVLREAHNEIESLGAELTHRLDCYEPERRESPGGMIEFNRRKCNLTSFCSTAKHCQSAGSNLPKLSGVISSQPPKRENIKRLQALRKLVSANELDDQDCRDLGDAVFSILAPSSFVILTTNVKDHRPLARAVGKDAISPEDIDLTQV